MPAKTPESILDPYRSLLGKVPDFQIASQAGVSRALVLAWRRRLGVEAYQGYKFGSPGHPTVRRVESGQFRGRRSRLDPFAHLLGKTSDAEIGRLAGVTAENVRTYRRRRGIKAEWRPAGADTQVELRAPRVRTRAPVRTVPVSTTEPRPGLAFAVTVRLGDEKRVYTLLAHNTGDAIRRAGPAIEAVCPEGRILGVQLVGEFLG